MGIKHKKREPQHMSALVWMTVIFLGIVAWLSLWGLWDGRNGWTLGHTIGEMLMCAMAAMGISFIVLLQYSYVKTDRNGVTKKMWLCKPRYMPYETIDRAEVHVNKGGSVSVCIYLKGERQKRVRIDMLMKGYAGLARKLKSKGLLVGPAGNKV